MVYLEPRQKPHDTAVHCPEGSGGGSSESNPACSDSPLTPWLIPLQTSFNNSRGGPNWTQS